MKGQVAVGIQAPAWGRAAVVGAAAEQGGGRTRTVRAGVWRGGLGVPSELPSAARLPRGAPARWDQYSNRAGGKQQQNWPPGQRGRQCQRRPCGGAAAGGPGACARLPPARLLDRPPEG